MELFLVREANLQETGFVVERVLLQLKVDPVWLELVDLLVLEEDLLLTFSQYEVVRDDAPAFLPCLVRFEIDCVLKREVFDPYLIDKALIRLDYFEGLPKAVLLFSTKW